MAPEVPVTLHLYFRHYLIHLLDTTDVLYIKQAQTPTSPKPQTASSKDSEGQGYNTQVIYLFYRMILLCAKT